MEQNRKLSHFLCSGPNFQFTYSGPDLLNDLKIGVVFNLCCRLGQIPVFKSLHNMVATCNFTHIPLNFLQFYNMSLVKFDPFPSLFCLWKCRSLHLPCALSSSSPLCEPSCQSTRASFFILIISSCSILCWQYWPWFFICWLVWIKKLSFWRVLPVQQRIGSY